MGEKIGEISDVVLCCVSGIPFTPVFRVHGENTKFDIRRASRWLVISSISSDVEQNSQTQQVELVVVILEVLAVQTRMLSALLVIRVVESLFLLSSLSRTQLWQAS